MKFYRYEAIRYGDGEFESYLEIKLKEYNLFKETPKGYWICFGGVTYPAGYKINYRSHLRWIPKESRKRHAYPTKEEALNNFKHRTRFRAGILESQLDDCKEILGRIKAMQENAIGIERPVGAGTATSESPAIAQNTEL